jgi:hypothetical protein
MTGRKQDSSHEDKSYLYTMQVSALLNISVCICRFTFRFQTSTVSAGIQYLFNFIHWSTTADILFEYVRVELWAFYTPSRLSRIYEKRIRV